jgi:hypothetical protein
MILNLLEIKPNEGLQKYANKLPLNLKFKKIRYDEVRNIFVEKIFQRFLNLYTNYS